MLAIFPDTFDVPAAAAVWKMEADAAQELLSRMVQYSVLEWNDTARHYQLHDLARQRLQPDEHNGAALNHAAYFLTILRDADQLYKSGGESLMRGLALFDIERSNIHSGQDWAASHASESQAASELCNSYPAAGVECLSLRYHPHERIRWLEAALAAATST